MFAIETLIIFILSCFVGYYVVLKVTPALHAPLMAVTNAISSVIIVVAIDAAAISSLRLESSVVATSCFGVVAVFLTAINIVGGFMLTHRMLLMFSKKKKDNGESKC
ncbi:MAG: proton-translocating transhydrogenase family protein [Holosporales bacterium]|jgi:NAD(P) transhydrogenase subunit alpha|nr:proton-translocating transhydrogenase family protein [Holosporales bacterium]